MKGAPRAMPNFGQPGNAQMLGRAMQAPTQQQRLAQRARQMRGTNPAQNRMMLASALQQRFGGR